jgi:hypothetical protein
MHEQIVRLETSLSIFLFSSVLVICTTTYYRKFHSRDELESHFASFAGISVTQILTHQVAVV